VTDRQLLKRLGENLRKARLSRGLTQERLAEMVDVTWQTISYLENGRHPVSVVTFAKMMRALGADPGSLFDGL
jgi:transcriptional regulator with XRE-family HTH domain